MSPLRPLLKEAEESEWRVFEANCSKQMGQGAKTIYH